MKSPLIAIMLLMFCISSYGEAMQPISVVANYDIYKGSMRIGRIEESFTRNKDHYTLTSTTQATGWLRFFNRGKIVISSSGLMNSQGLQPQFFSDQRIGNEEKNRQAELDWVTKQLTLIQKDQHTSVELPAGTQDRISAMYQFMFLPLKIDTTLNFSMTNGGKLDDYHYLVAQGETLKTPAGEFKTLYLDSQAKAGENRTEIWLATEHQNFPCKMTITDADGDQLTQILSKLEIKTTAK